ncbi:MAG: GumC family protein, partial [Planctomycetota bacterium]
MADTSGSESNFGGMELIQALRRRYYVILAALAVSVSLSVLLARSRPEKYRATARILIEPRRSRFSSAENEAGTVALYFFYTKELQTQRLLIESKPVARRLVEKLGSEKLGLQEGDPDPAEAARGLYEARPVSETRFIDVSCLATDPELAAEIANAVADGYIEEALQERQRLLNETMAAYSRRVPERLKELEKAEAELLRFKEEHNIVSSDKPEEVLRREEINLVEQLSQARQERMSCQSKLKAQSADGVIGNPHKDIARGVAGDDAWVRQVLDKRLAQRALLTELARSYSAGHPKLESAKTAMAEIQRELDEAARSYYERLQLKYDAAIWKENDIERLLVEHRARIVRMSKLLSRYENLQQRRDSLRALLEPVARSQAELDFIANLNLPSASVTERASPPPGPCEPSIPKYVLVGLILGSSLGFALVRLLESADESVRTPDDLARAAPVKVPGVVSHIKRDVARSERARALATADRSGSVIAEQFRSLRTGLTTMEPWGKESPHGVVLVTSSGLSEGKTTVCFNTAEAFAQLGKPVVIVDADL